MKHQSKAPCAISQQSANSSGNLHFFVVDEVMSWWEERDTQLMPFMNFYILVIRYQIQNEFSDEKLAEDLDVKPRAIAFWRSAIKSHGVLEGLIIEIHKKYYNRKTVPFMRRLKRKLFIQRRLIDRRTIPSERSDAGCPRDIFPLPCPDERFQLQAGLLRPLHFAVMGEMASTPSIGRLKKFVFRLNWAHEYRGKKSQELESSRKKLMHSVETVGSLYAKVCFSDSFLSFEPTDLLGDKLASALDGVRESAQSYHTQLMLRISNDELWWGSISICDLQDDNSFRNLPKIVEDLSSIPFAEADFASFSLQIDDFAKNMRLPETKTRFKKMEIINTSVNENDDQDA